MSIASAIQNAQQKVTNAYTAVNNKGGTLPATQNLSNLPNAINSIPTATEPTLASLTVTPSTTAQTLTPPSGTDGYNTVKVNAVTSAIDSDIQAGNIKSGVNILGVTGTVTALAGETRTVSITSTSGNTFTPSSGKNGITSIKCNPTNKALTITPTTTTQTFTVPTNYSGYGTVTCGAGTQPSGTYTITANGTYDVTNYASANVSVSGGGGGSVSAPIFEANYVVSTNGSITNIIRFQTNANSCTYILKPFAKSLANSTTVHNWLNSDLNEVNDAFTGIRSIAATASFSAGTGSFSAFELAFDATTEFISFRALEEAIFTDVKAFRLLTSLKKVDLHNAKKVVLTAAFSGLSNFQEIDLTSVEDLTTVRALGGTASIGGAFANTSVSTLSFPSLKSTSFGSYTNQFAYMLKGVTECTVHFPSNLQSVIGSWSDVTSGFGGTNTTILFDLPATT